MLDAGALIKKYKAKGVFVDTNLLVLLLVGLVNARRVETFKRTRDFAVDDFYLLRKLILWFGTPIFSTPHVLSQVSDLTDLSGPELTKVRTLFRATIATVEEQHDRAVELADHPMFERFGLSDTSIAAVAKRSILVLTTDLELHIELAARGLNSLNFNHVRELGWFRT